MFDFISKKGTDSKTDGVGETPYPWEPLPPDEAERSAEKVKRIFEENAKRRDALRRTQLYKDCGMAIAGIVSLAILFVTSVMAFEAEDWRIALIGVASVTLIMPCIVALISFHNDHGGISIPFSSEHPSARIARLELLLRAGSFAALLALFFGILYLFIAFFGFESLGWSSVLTFSFALMVFWSFRNIDDALDAFLISEILWHLNHVSEVPRPLENHQGATHDTVTWNKVVVEQFTYYLTSWNVSREADNVIYHASFVPPQALSGRNFELTMNFYYQPNGNWTT
ncbi:MAG: hypothetical protein A2V79_03740 [Betaproteobacteria bacterium RBG_16_56_24]|nr:MAG: hypothetical protein A2V79_03740 [Betaproteobacteria bacterium RBG_16_56_24]